MNNVKYKVKVYFKKTLGIHAAGIYTAQGKI